MCRQQLESVFTTPSTPKSTPKPTLKPKKPTLFLEPKKHELTSIATDEEFGGNIFPIVTEGKLLAWN